MAGRIELVLVPKAVLDELESITKYRHCMSYNDSYFSEPPGMLKITVRKIEKLFDAQREQERQDCIPKCACCGTTENLHRDYGSGGPYRCNSSGCMVF